jgi:arylsulfatase
MVSLAASSPLGWHVLSDLSNTTTEETIRDSYLCALPDHKGGTGVLKVDGKEVDRKTIPNTIANIFQWDETFDVGSDTGKPVDDRDYQCPFAFTGKLTEMTIEVGPMQVAAEEKKAMQKKIGERD